jgi:hypothetical protein
MPYSSADWYQPFGTTYCFHLQGRRDQVPPKVGVISENTVNLIFCEDFRSLVFSILGLLPCSEVTNHFLSCVVRKLVSCIDASAD